MVSRENLPVQRQRVIGLTGGIGMGKTTVSNYLATVHQLPVLDADVLARAAVDVGTPILAAIADRYGSGVLLADGQLNRQQLGSIIFNSPAERLWLEQCIHPYVRDCFVQAMQTSPLDDVQHSPIIVLVIPLLFEARMTDLVTETWVVVCSVEHQLKRVMERDRLSEKQARARIHSQMSIQKKISRADVVLENDSTDQTLYQQIDKHLGVAVTRR